MEIVAGTSTRSLKPPSVGELSLDRLNRRVVCFKRVTPVALVSGVSTLPLGAAGIGVKGYVPVFGKGCGSQSGNGEEGELHGGGCNRDMKETMFVSFLWVG